MAVFVRAPLTFTPHRYTPQLWAGLRCAAPLSLLASLLLASPLAQAMGSAAPFTPPKHTAAAASGVAESAPAVPDASSAGLAGVRLGKPSAALIDGQWVAPGATVRGAQLTQLNQAGATLRHSDGRLEFMPLTPGVQWVRRAAATATAPTAPTAKAATTAPASLASSLSPSSKRVPPHED